MISAGTGDSTQPTQLTPNTSALLVGMQRTVFLLSSKGSAHLVLFSFAYWQQIFHFSFTANTFLYTGSTFVHPFVATGDERTSLGSPGHAPKVVEGDLTGPGSAGGGSSLLCSSMSAHSGAALSPPIADPTKMQPCST